MSSPHHDLAARFRASVSHQKARQRAGRAEQESLDAADGTTRDSLLDLLEDFAEEAAFFEISRAGPRLVLRYDRQALRFEPVRAGPDLQVRCLRLGQECRLEFLPDRQAWQVVFVAPQGRRTAFDLFPRGLEILISRCFHIRPAETPAAAAASAAGDPDEHRPRLRAAR